MTILSISRSAQRFLFPNRPVASRVLMTIFTVVIILSASIHPLVSALWQTERPSFQNELVVGTGNGTDVKKGAGLASRFCPEQKLTEHPLYSNFMNVDMSHGGCGPSFFASVTSPGVLRSELRSQSAAEVLKGMVAALLTRPPRPALV